jgi:hypothetical protein
MESARWSFDAVAARSVVSDLPLGNWGGRNLAIVRGPVKTPLRGLELPSDRVIRLVGCAPWCEGPGFWLNPLPVCLTDGAETGSMMDTCPGTVHFYGAWATGG